MGVRGLETLQPGPATGAAPDNRDAPALDPYRDLDRPADGVPLGVAAGAIDTTDIDQRIAFWQDRARHSPRSETAWTYIGDLLEQKGRQTGDVGQYATARLSYEKAIEIAPASMDARSGLARILATLHDFPAAIEQATAVLAADPAATGALGVLFDASLELGDLENADRALSLLRDRADGPAVGVRQARIAFVRGSTAEALSLAAQARDEAAGRGEDAAGMAFYHYALAEYQMLAGDLDSAAASYASAMRSVPGYVLAVAGEGRIAYARGDLATAIERYEAATAALPRPDLVAYLGDLYALAGDQSRADDQYALVDFIAGLGGTAPERVYDREYAGFLADHGRDAAEAVRLARNELVTRRDVYGHDALAWSLLADGQTEEALAASRAALALGTTDARLLAHAGLIELANGLAEEGRAHLQQSLDLHASFSPLVVERVRQAVAP